MKIFSYVVSRDFGFAPNPFFNYCTLATCKPKIRKDAKIGDWIIGTNSTIKNNPRHLVFAMKVEEKITFNEYWTDSRFINKKPILSGSRKYQYGDNIYHKENNEWNQSPSHHSEEDGSPNLLNIKTDTQYDGVLISSVFYYFGRNSIALPPNLQEIIKIGRGHKYIDSDLHNKLFDFLNKNPLGINGNPSDWETLSLQSKQLNLIF